MLKYIHGELKKVNRKKTPRPIETVMDSLICQGLKDFEKVAMRKRASFSYEGGKVVGGIIEHFFLFSSEKDARRAEKAIQKYFNKCDLEFYLCSVWKEDLTFWFDYEWKVEDKVPIEENNSVKKALELNYVKEKDLNLNYTDYDDWCEDELGTFVIEKGKMSVKEDYEIFDSNYMN